MGLVLCAAIAGAATSQTAPADRGGIDTTVLPPPEAAGEAPRPLIPRPDVAPGEVAPEPDTPHAAALAGAEEAEREAVLAFYEARDFAPFWSEANAAEALLATLAEAGRQGLPPSRYDLERLAEGDDPVAAEIGLTRAYLAYARDMTGGLLDPQAVDPEINLDQERPDDRELLARLGTGTPETALAELAPDAAEYEALIAERERLADLARSGGWGEPVPEDGPALRLGDTDPRVEALRDRLSALGHPAPGEGMRFDAELEAALKEFQAANGLLDDGVLGRRTLAALNASPEDRIAQITVNLERMRWLPDDRGERYVWVNIPDYTVSVFESGEQVYHTRSVVGEAGKTRTPEFSDTMTYLVVNPTWYIPDSIAKRVYLPKLRQDPNVLRDNDMRLFTRSGTEIDPGLVNFAALGDAFPFRVRQNPSPANALGRVKFMFPNQFAIYLHDTPARELFDRDARAFSNGCVRLEDPFELAHYLLAPQLENPEETFAAWIEAGVEKHVTLEEPIQVHIVYRTAWADAEGVHFREDIYGRDATVLAALRAAGVELPPEATETVSMERAG